MGAAPEIAEAEDEEEIVEQEEEGADEGFLC